MDIFNFFNSKDVAAYCQKANYKLSAMEMAYVVWRSNHHTLMEKHQAWDEIINTMPDEEFLQGWNQETRSLHDFLKMYMCLQNDYYQDFCTAKDSYVYTYAYTQNGEHEFVSDNFFYNSYHACMIAVHSNLLEADADNEIGKVKISRYRLYSSALSNATAEDCDSIVFDRSMKPMEVEPSKTNRDVEASVLSGPSGFAAMWITIPTPFQRGDIVVNIGANTEFGLNHKPLLLAGGDLSERNFSLRAKDDETMLQADICLVDQKTGFWFQNEKGELIWDRGLEYLDCEYYRGELKGVEKNLLVVGEFLTGKIDLAELLKKYSLCLLQNCLFNI